MHEPLAHIVSARTEARSWLQIRIGEQPLVPDEVAGCGAPAIIIEAAHARLAQLQALQRARARRLRMHQKPHSGRYSTEAE